MQQQHSPLRAKAAAAPDRNRAALFTAAALALAAIWAICLG